MRYPRAERLSVASTAFLQGLPPALASSLREVMADEPFRVTHRWTGHNATCELLDGPSGRVVLKRSRPLEPVAYEAEVFNAAAAHIELAGRVPKVLAVFPEFDALLMEYLCGETTRDRLRRDGPGTLALELHAAMRAFHRALGHALRDFHADNVVWRQTGPTFIDPSPPGAYGIFDPEHPVVADLAVWTYQSCANLASEAARSPLACLRLWRLNVALLRLAPTDDSGVRVKDIEAATTRRLRGLWASGRREKAKAAIGWACCRSVFFATALPARRSR